MKIDLDVLKALERTGATLTMLIAMLEIENARREHKRTADRERIETKRAEIRRDITRHSATNGETWRRGIGSPEFAQFKAVYPKRDGSYSWTEARKLFEGKLQTGTTAEEICAGAQRYAVRERERIGTPYIMQPTKFLRKEVWREGGESEPARDDVSVNGWKPGMPTAEELEAKWSTANGHDDERPGLEEGEPMV